MANPATVVRLADVRLRQECETPAAPGDARTLLQKAWDAYVTRVIGSGDIKPSSARTFVTCMRRALDPERGLPPRPDRRDVENWLLGLRSEGLKDATVNKYLATLRVVTKDAARLLKDDALRDLSDDLQVLRKRAVERAEKVAATRAGIEWLCRVAYDRGDAEFVFAVRLAAYALLRRGEIQGLRCDDVRQEVLRDGAEVTYLHVRRTFDRHGERGRKNARGGSLHVVQLDEETAAYALEMRRRREFTDAGAWQDSKLLLGWSSPSALQARWATYRRRYPNMFEAFRLHGWHALRHWGASELARQGASVVEIQRSLGDRTPTAALTYVDQVRGTTGANSARLAAGAPVWGLPGDKRMRQQTLDLAALAQPEQPEWAAGYGGPGHPAEEMTGAPEGAPAKGTK